MRAIATLLALVLSVLLNSSAHAEGLVQLSIQGEIGLRGGAPIEVELGFWNGVEVTPLSLNIHLAERTRAEDLAVLLASRLRRVGAKVELPGDGNPVPGPVHLFIDSVTYVHLRLGHGIWGTVTLCDSAPASIRVQAPEIAREGAELFLAATTFHPHNRKLGRAAFFLEIDELATAGEISEKLANEAISRGWVADRPAPDRWAASRTRDGAAITGLSIELRSPGADWRLEVELEVPRVDGVTQR